MKELGIIGFGNFGKLLAEALKPFFTIFIYDPEVVIEEVHELGVLSCSLDEATSKDVVILAVPVGILENVLIQIKDKLKENALILDVSSVKVKPVTLMEKYLPKNVELIGTHPLFGPESGKNGFENLNITLCPIRTKSMNCLKMFLIKNFKLKIYEETAEKHDKEMAYVQVLTHFVAQALHQINIPKPYQSTKAYENLFTMKEYLKNDSKALFMTLQKENPFATDIRNEFIEKLKQIEHTISS